MNSPMNGEKFFKLFLTKFLWLLVAFLTGLSFTLYWGNAPDLVLHFVTGEAPFPAYATTLFLTATTFVMAGLAREQVCTYMCPYARFQGVMFDKDTLIVAYDQKRGEAQQGRSKPKKGLVGLQERRDKGYGDCIDCGYCVQVCPTGIDIRNGMQYQCISCALCIDACDTIMDSINYPRGLVSYSSENKMEHGTDRRWTKPKNLGYGLAILAVTVLLIWSVATRELTQLSVSQVRQPLYVVLSDGRIQNRYEIKITNKSDNVQSYTMKLEGLPGAELDMGNFADLSLGVGESAHLHVQIKQAATQQGQHQQKFLFVLEGGEPGANPPVKQAAVFYHP